MILRTVVTLLGIGVVTLAHYDIGNGEVGQIAKGKKSLRAVPAPFLFVLHLLCQ